MVPERELIAEYLGRPDDIIETPTPAQRIIYGETRRRIPLLWDVDNPVMSGLVAKPGLVHAERGGPAAVLLRSHPGAD